MGTSGCAGRAALPTNSAALYCSAAVGGASSTVPLYCSAAAPEQLLAVAALSSRTGDSTPTFKETSLAPDAADPHRLCTLPPIAFQPPAPPPSEELADPHFDRADAAEDLGPRVCFFDPVPVPSPVALALALALDDPFSPFASAATFNQASCACPWKLIVFLNSPLFRCIAQASISG